ncbi:MAG TPA: alpha-D-ribose 1-methylphosphonate 5-triphosphate diphosphatase [Xanthobacteraceae bacterium]|jgi:alpha-D-ribose 1-methylphosphonate 5-triphosphate diphosphatase|nr:alpha-D-ribose 1-methylphosphonate 5-triphosphate diphosphatase [Xanthobacteraceae bacterium]
MDIRITGANVLTGGELLETNVHTSDGVIAEVGADSSAASMIDADGLILLPGIVDMHGDAFERQIMPRPGVDFAVDLALTDTDRQVIANGITTVFHGVTWSWEPGLRGPENARNLLAAMETLRPRLAADTRYHLRFETFNLAAEPEACDWLHERKIDALAFNDHMLAPDYASKPPPKLGTMIDRTGLSREDFFKLIASLRSRSGEVPDLIARLAKSANAAGIPLISHDDSSPEQRRWFRSLGCRVCEFPTNIETAQDAIDAGDQIVFGAPNIVRGKSHVGWVNARDMVERGLCSILASDYFYPAPLVAAFRLIEAGMLPLAKAWDLISGTPARAMNLADRGSIAPEMRADLILVDAAIPVRPRVVAVLVAGQIVYLTEPQRFFVCA